MEDMKFLDSSLISRRYQITLTKDVRKELEIQEGDKIIFYKKGDEVIIRKA